MIKEVVAKTDQTIIDIVMEHTGDVDMLYNVLAINDFNGGDDEVLTNVVPVGTVIKIDTDWINEKVIKGYAD